MTVKTLITILKRELRSEVPIHCPFDLSCQQLSSGQSFDEIIHGYGLAAIKYLANDGFIKLGSATKFENREILQYHATAEPEFCCGKFRL